MKRSPHGVLLVSGRQTHQENYGPQFLNDERCQVVGLSDEKDIPSRRLELNRALADDLGLAYIEDLDSALDSSSVEIVSVCAEPERRARIVAQCAARGKHVYIDKPMTPYLDAADEVVAAVQTSRVHTQMFSFVTAPWALRAKAIVETGEIGDLLAVHVDNMFAKGPGGQADPDRPIDHEFPPRRFTFVDSKRELYAIGIYALGLVTWLCQREVERVYGFTANYFLGPHQKNRVEDFGLLSLHLAGGVQATLTGGRTGWTSHADSGLNQVCLIGSKGSLMLDALSPRLEVRKSGRPWEPPTVNPEDPMGFWSSTQKAANIREKSEWRALPVEASPKSDVSSFIDRLEAGRDGDMNAAAAAHLTEVLLAGYESAATGEVVKLPLKRGNPHQQSGA